MPEITVKEAKEAIDGLASTFEQYKKANDERLAEIDKNGKASGETEQKVAKLEKAVGEAENVKKRLDDIEVALKRRGPSTQEQKKQELNEAQAEYKEALLGYMRKGDETNLENLQKKALAVQSDPDGGFFVTPDTSGRMVTRIFETSPIRQVASVQQITTDALEGVIDDDEAGYEWVGETEAPANKETPRIGKWRIPAHEMATRPKATQKLLEDSAVDVESWLMSKVTDRFARAENTAFVNGNGVAKPRGFLTYPDNVGDPDDYEYGHIGRVTTGADNVVDSDDLINLLYNLKNEYRVSATWAMNRLTFGVIRKLKDENGQYLWQPSLQIGEPATLLGRPTLELNDMPDVEDGTLPIALADFGRTYQIVDRVGIAVLRDPYTAKPYVEFYTRRRVGGDVINFDSIKLLQIQ